MITEEFAVAVRYAEGEARAEYTLRGRQYLQGAAARSSPVVILLNGSLFHQAQWFVPLRCGLLQRLLDNYRIVTFDYGGTGSSTGQGVPWSIERLGAEVLAVADQVSPDAPVHLFGSSKGTLAAQAAVARAPQRVASLSGYGWFHLGYSHLEKTQHFFATRVKKFSYLQQLPYEPVTWRQFNELWETAYRQIIADSSGVPGWLSKILGKAIKRVVFALVVPTPVRTAYDWFCYGVEQMLRGREFFAQVHPLLVQKPVQIMHARGDRTLPFGMAEELHQALPQSELVTLEDGYNHVSPHLFPHHARKLSVAYTTFLHGITVKQ